MSTRLKGLLFAVVAVVLFPAEAPAQTGICDGVPALQAVSAQALPVNVVLDRGRDATQIALSARTLTNYLGPSWHTNGLATANLQFYENMEMVGQSDAQEACYGLSNLSISYGYIEPIQVLMVNKYAPGTCPYTAIFNHEMQHVAIYRDGITGREDLVRSLATAYLAQRLPVRAATVEQAEEGIKQVVNEAVTLMTGILAKGMQDRNAVLDTPQNYAAVQSLCSDW